MGNKSSRHQTTASNSSPVPTSAPAPKTTTVVTPAKTTVAAKNVNQSATKNVNQSAQPQPEKSVDGLERGGEVKLGEFVCKGSLVVTDPTYNVEKNAVAEGQLYVSRARKGSWTVFSRSRSDGVVKSLYAMCSEFVDELTPEYAKQYLDGPHRHKEAIEVDEGIIGIFDLTNYDNDAPVPPAENNVTTYGVSSPSGYGNGRYDCVTYLYAGKVVYVKIILVTSSMAKLNKKKAPVAETNPTSGKGLTTNPTSGKGKGNKGPVKTSPPPTPVSSDDVSESESEESPETESPPPPTKPSTNNKTDNSLKVSPSVKASMAVVAMVNDKPVAVSSD